HRFQVLAEDVGPRPEGDDQENDQEERDPEDRPVGLRHEIEDAGHRDSLPLRVARTLSGPLRGPTDMGGEVASEPSPLKALSREKGACADQRRLLAPRGSRGTSWPLR